MNKIKIQRPKSVLILRLLLIISVMTGFAFFIYSTWEMAYITTRRGIEFDARITHCVMFIFNLLFLGVIYSYIKELRSPLAILHDKGIDFIAVNQPNLKWSEIAHTQIFNIETNRGPLTNKTILLDITPKDKTILVSHLGVVLKFLYKMRPYKRSSISLEIPEKSIPAISAYLENHSNFTS